MPFDAMGLPPDAAAPETPHPLRAFVRALQRRVGRASGLRNQRESVAVLEAARALIETEDRWMQGFYFKFGRRCAMGALQEAGRHFRGPARRDASAELLKIAQARGHHCIESMNDHITHREVLGAFDAAVAGIIARRT